MELKVIEHEFSICKVEDYSQTDLDNGFTFIGRTDVERSLVCPTVHVPSNTIVRDDGWRALRVQGALDLSLIGILSKILDVLAREGVAVFTISTYDTDYVLVKGTNLQRTIDSLMGEGYDIVI